MWIIFVLLFYLNVPLYYTIASNPDLSNFRVIVIKNNDSISSLYNSNSYPNDCYYDTGDNITLTCTRKWSVAPKPDATLRWKLTQPKGTYRYQLMVSTATEKTNDLEVSYQARITLDKYDHHLNVTCEASDNESIPILFKQDSDVKNYADEIITYNRIEDVPVPKNSTALLHTHGSWAIAKDIQLGDYIPASDNDNIYVYTVWIEKEENPYDLKTKVISIKKKIFKVSDLPGPRDEPDTKTIKYQLETTTNSPGKPPSFPTVAVVAGAIGLVTILLVTVFVYYKYFKKRQMINDNIYEHIIYAEPFKPTVIYAEIDLKELNYPASKLPEAPNAKIIGILKQN